MYGILTRSFNEIKHSVNDDDDDNDSIFLVSFAILKLFFLFCRVLATNNDSKLKSLVMETAFMLR